MTERDSGFNYFLETVNTGAVDYATDEISYLFESGYIVTGMPALGVRKAEIKGRRALWVTDQDNKTICVAPAYIVRDQVEWEKDNLIVPLRDGSGVQKEPLIDKIPEKIPQAEVTIPKPQDHPDKI